MTISADWQFLIAVWMIFVRLSAFFLFMPLFSILQIPLRIRILTLLPLAYLLAASVFDTATLGSAFTGWNLFKGLVYEFIIGSAMAFGLFASFGALQLGGRILDFQMGFGIANLIDPSTNSQSPLLGTLLYLMAIGVFFGVDGHLLLVKGIDYSLETLPPGAGLFSWNIGLMVRQFGLMFIYGLMVVAPVIFSLFLIDVGMAVAARTMPQVNMFIVSLPLKIFVGLLVLTISLAFMGSILTQIYESIALYLEGIVDY